MRVLVAGGGIAALEALAGLRALAGERVALTLLAPEGSFSYRPLSTAVPFSFLQERARKLAALANGLGATFVHDGLAQVDAARRRVMTHNGDFLPYDALVLAVGARTSQARHGITWRRGQAGLAALSHLLHELEDGTARRLAVVVPRGTAWPVDGYELALVASLAAGRSGPGATVSIVTAESAPLEAFGPEAARAVAEELARAGVDVITGVEATVPDARQEAGRDAFSAAVARVSRPERRPQRGGELTLDLRPGPSLTVERALFLPSVHGPAVSGVAHDHSGFVPVDEHARVPGSEEVYAAGDVTALSLKHSTLASGQGTAAAEAIAAVAGAEIDPQPWSSTLFGILTLPPHYPTAGSPWLENGEPVSHCLWWPPGHVAGRHLAPYLASSDPGVRPGLNWHPHGIAVAVPVEAYAEAAVTVPPVPAEAAVNHDARTRQLMAIRRDARAGKQLQRELARHGQEVELHRREVVAKLRAAGYLREA